MYLLEPEFRNEPLLLIPPQLCLTIHSFCLEHLETETWTSYYTISEIANYVCYVLLPMVLVLGMLGQLLNFVTLVRQIRLSLETYLLALCLESILLIVCAVILCLPHYIGYSRYLVLTQYYTLVCREAVWFAFVWTLVGVGLQQCVQSFKHAPFYICIISSFAISSALPLVWQYSLTSEDIQTDHLMTNRSNYSVTLIQNIQPVDNNTLSVVYFWYSSSISIFVPTFLTGILCTALTILMFKRGNISQSYNASCRSSATVIFHRSRVEERAKTKLVIQLLILMVLMMFPLGVLNFLCHALIGILEENTMVTVFSNIATVLFHMYLVLIQQLYFCYHKQYRTTLISMWDCCCWLLLLTIFWFIGIHVWLSNKSWHLLLNRLTFLQTFNYMYCLYYYRSERTN